MRFSTQGNFVLTLTLACVVVRCILTLIRKFNFLKKNINNSFYSGPPHTRYCIFFFLHQSLQFLEKKKQIGSLSMFFEDVFIFNYQ